MSCLLCSEEGILCQPAKDSSQCEQCVRVGRLCNKISDFNTFEFALKAQTKIEEEQTVLEDKIMFYREQVNTEVTKLLRLRKANGILRTQTDEFFAIHIARLDKEDAEERAATGKEQLIPNEEIEAYEKSAHNSINEPTTVDWSSVDWAALGLAGFHLDEEPMEVAAVLGSPSTGSQQDIIDRSIRKY